VVVEVEVVVEEEVAGVAAAGSAAGYISQPEGSGRGRAAWGARRPTLSAANRFFERGSGAAGAAGGSPRRVSIASRKRSPRGRSAHGAWGRPLFRAGPWRRRRRR